MWHRHGEASAEWESHLLNFYGKLQRYQVYSGANTPRDKSSLLASIRLGNQPPRGLPVTSRGILGRVWGSRIPWCPSWSSTPLQSSKDQLRVRIYMMPPNCSRNYIFSPRQSLINIFPPFHVFQSFVEKMNAGKLKAFVFWHGNFSWEADSHVKDLTAGELRALPIEKSNGLTQPCTALLVQSRRGSAVMTTKGRSEDAAYSCGSFWLPKGNIFPRAKEPLILLGFRA